MITNRNTGHSKKFKKETNKLIIAKCWWYISQFDVTPVKMIIRKLQHIGELSSNSLSLKFSIMLSLLFSSFQVVGSLY